MTDTFAASLAFLAAGVTLLTHALSWASPFKPLVSAVAIITMLVLVLRRHGSMSRTTGAAVSAITGTTIAVIALLAIPASSQQTGPVLAVAGGLLIIAFSYADARAFTRHQVLTKLQAASLGLALGLFSLLAVFGWAVLLRTGLGRVLSNTTLLQPVIAGIALALAALTITGLVLAATDRPTGFIDIAVPDSRDVGYVIGGLIIITALNVLISVGVRQAGFAPIQHDILQSAQTTPVILLSLVPLSIFLIGPGEELLYRNIIQKLLYDAYSRPAAIIVASLIFASTHLFAYSTTTPSLVPIATALSGVFVLSVVLGIVYERTNNILVPMAVHGAMNALIFAAAYIQLTTP